MSKLLSFLNKGGPGSGHHGHKGIPGSRGGSLPGIVNRILQYDLFNSSKPIPEVADSDRSVLVQTISSIEKTIGMDLGDALFTFQETIVGSTLGATTSFKGGPLRGTKVIAISPSKIDKAIEKEGDKLGSWFGMPLPITHDTVLSHMIAHEIGHSWIQNASDSVKTSWSKTSDQNWKTMSGYARYNKSNDEAFSDAFAGFSLGYNLPQPVENWFLDNTNILSKSKEFSKSIYTDIIKQIARLRTPKDRRAMLLLRQELYNERVEELTDDLRDEVITLAIWMRGMKSEMKQMHLMAAAIGMGDWQELTSADLGLVGRNLRDQYGYLDGFVKDIAANDGEPWSKRFLNRALLYGAAAGVEFFLMDAKIDENKDSPEYRWSRSPVDSCQTCLDNEAMGWVPVGSFGMVPRDGQTICGVACKCDLIYK